LSGNVLPEQAEEPHWLEYPAEKKKDTLVTVVADTIVSPDTVLVIDGFTLHEAEPNNMVLLLDVSGSMNAAEKLPLMKEAFHFLVLLMRKEDMVSVISYSGIAKLVLPPTQGDEKEKIISRLDSLESKGATDADKGISTALKTVQKKY